MKSLAGHFRSATIYLLAMLIVAPPCALARSLSVGVERVDDEGVTAGPLDGRAQLAELRRQLKALYVAVEESLRSFPYERTDPKALAAKLGSEPEMALNYIREKTSLVAYSGVLRGARGVLVDGTGNSLDRALLLAALLDPWTFEVRLARATLSPDLVKASVLPLASLPFQRMDSEPWPGQDALGEDGFAGDADSERLLEEIASRANQQSEHLKLVVQERAEPASTEVSRAAAIAALSDHWWVQYRSLEDSGEWLDLDPVLEPNEPRRSLMSAESTFASDSVPDELFHELRIRVVVSQAGEAEGELEERIPLEHSLRAADHYGEQMRLRQKPLHSPEGIELLEDRAGALEKVKALAAEQTEWVPILQVGSEVISRASYDIEGELNENPNLSTESQKFAEATKGLTDLGRLPGASVDRLTGVHVEYQTKGPNETVRTIRRPLYEREYLEGDSRERALRRGLALAETVDILPTAGALSAASGYERILEHLVQNRTVVIQLLNAGQQEEQDLGDIETLLSRSNPLPLELYSLGILRHSLHPQAEKLYQARQGVLTFRKGIDIAEDGELVAYRGFDIVDNPIEVRPVAELSALDRFGAVLSQGVLDSVLEAKLMLGQGARIGASDFLAQQDQANWSLVDRHGEIGEAGVLKALPERSRDSIREQVQSGSLAYVADKPASDLTGSSGMWWRIDPSTGECLAMSGPGRGACDEMVSYTVLLRASALGALIAVISFFGCYKMGDSGSKAAACGVCAVLTYAMVTMSVLATLMGAGPPAIALLTGDSAAALCFAAVNQAY